MKSPTGERVACSQICPGCHVLPARDRTINFEVTCDHAVTDDEVQVGFIPAYADSNEPELGLIVALACTVPEKKMLPV